MAASKAEARQILEERTKLETEMMDKGYDYLEGGYIPIKIAAQPNEALLNLINKYRPTAGRNFVYEEALQVLKNRGVM